MLKKINNDGFTLLEVLIAIAIFTISFMVMVDSQNMNIRSSSHANKTTTAMILAQEKLSEVILKYKNKSLSEIPEKEEGTFETPYSKYRWEMTSRNFAYDLSFLTQLGKEKKEDEEPESPLAPYIPKISAYIKKVSKEISVTVLWKEGATEYKSALTTHVFNYKEPVGL